MPYPDNFSTAAYDAAQGRDETPEAEPEDVYEAARDFLYALDRNYIAVDRPTSAFVTALRDAVTREREARAADEARRNALFAALRTKVGAVS